MTADVQAINQRARDCRARLDPLYDEMGKVIVGQRPMLDRLLVGLLTGGYVLHQPFLVLATQNPIEQEGTYPLPEAQVDRFMLKLKLTYPNKEEELATLERMAAVEPNLRVSAVLGTSDLVELRQALDQTYM